MKKPEMADFIFGMLASILPDAEFRLKKSEGSFVRKITNGRQALGVPLWDYNPEFQFSLNICIRLEAVEKIFHQFSGAPPKYHSMSFTMMSRLEYFTNGPAKYSVRTPENVASAGQVLSPLVRSKIVPFFNRNEDVPALDRTVNSEHPGIDITQNPSGAMHSVILAHLAGNADVDRLVVKHRNDMQLGPEVEHPFNRLVEYLGTR